MAAQAKLHASFSLGIDSLLVWGAVNIVNLIFKFNYDYDMDFKIWLGPFWFEFSFFFFFPCAISSVRG